VIVFVAAATALTVYLFVNAPPALSARTTGERHTMPIRAVFALLQQENSAARALWTEEIVQHGTAAGLAFGEHWQDAGVAEGPLPALFLRETARNLEQTRLHLRVFLGSPYPINRDNQLTGVQAVRFAAVEQTGIPEQFFEPSTGMQTAMFADRAVAEGCVTCHNEHPGSPKTDWRLHDVMGATTWMYPDEAVSVERAVELIGALRSSIRAAYTSYLAKAAAFPHPPEIGARWPRDGYYLPNPDVFMAELASRTSTATMQGLLDPPSALAPSGPLLASAVTATPIAQPPALEPDAVAGHPSPVPQLVIRSTRSTRVTVDHADHRLMITRLPAGAATSLTSRPPLRIKLSQPSGVEIEYAGKKVPIPEPRAKPDDDPSKKTEVEIVVPDIREES
jgi:hypothetical protein